MKFEVNQEPLELMKKIIKKKQGESKEKALEHKLGFNQRTYQIKHKIYLLN